MLTKIITLSLVLSFLFFQKSFAQSNALSLRACVDLALKNNLDLISQNITTVRNKLALQQSYANVLPTINGGGGLNYNFGRTIDRFTNQFVEGVAVRSDNYFLQAQLNLFNGLQNYNSIKQNQMSLQSTKLDFDVAKNNLILNVANAFLQVLLSSELLTVSTNQVSQTDKRITLLKKQVDAGVVNKLELLNIQSQKGTDELNLVNADNNYQQARLNLMQLMNVADDSLQIASFENIDKYLVEIFNPTLQAVYTAALKSRPEILSQEIKLRSSIFAKRASVGRALPSVSASASIGSGYSGLRKDIVGSPIISGKRAIGFTEVTDPITSQLIQLPTYEPTFDVNTQTTSFKNQINQNVNRSLGLSFQLPIFNGLGNYAAIQQAKLNILVAENNVSIAKQQLFKAVQQSYLAMSSAQKKWKVAQESFAVQKEAFKQAEQRFDNGLLNSTDFAQQKNIFQNSESNLLQAKYDYVFKLKVVELYMNNNIEL